MIYAMKHQIANRLGVAHVRDTVMQLVAGSVTREQAMEDLHTLIGPVPIIFSCCFDFVFMPIAHLLPLVYQAAFGAERCPCVANKSVPPRLNTVMRGLLRMNRLANRPPICFTNL